MKWTTRLGKALSVCGAWTATTLTLGLAAAACLSRPVGQQPPTTKVNFTSTVSQQAVDKVDLLFAIDNSASMGDKQAILAEAVPDLINGLLRPRCVDSDGKPDPQGSTAEPTGSKENRYGCPAGYEPEFKPVTDMHIGIVSSSLGSFGGDVCDETVPRQNDRGHLININPQGGEVAAAKPSNFLAWFPQSPENEDSRRHPPPKNPIRTIEELSENFAKMVVGVGQNGCGLEAQLESVYRFLIQPDPWDSVKRDQNGQANLGEGVDIEVLQQRADFLRPDSLVAIIMLTDEDDSSVDPLSIGGQGWAFMSREFPGSRVRRSSQGTTAPRGTSICEDDPASADCTSCGFQDQCDASTASCQKVKSDPNCRTTGLQGQSGPGFDGYYGPKEDELNVRFHRMKQRFGIDPQYPLRRYIDGLTKYRVPDRKAEHVIRESGGRREIASYTHTPKCTNPLFAAKLPREPGDELCALPRSTRTPDLIFFAVVGGVPNQLLYPDGKGGIAYDPNNPEANRMTNEKWIKVLGRDPMNYDTTGIDPHMIQSVEPRKELAGEEGLPRGDNGTDPIHGREWKTNKEDLQYACTFPLPEAMQRECVKGDNSCDCGPRDADDERNPPLCNSGNRQIRAKAYPTIREFMVVRALGDQGIAASLCPIQLTDKSAPTYGYRPAVAAIIDRLKNALTTQCLPQKLIPNEQGVPCLVLAQLSDPGDSCDRYGLKPPKKEILDVFLEQQRQESGNVSEGGLDLSKLPVCEIPQERVERGATCKDNTSKVWCYVENDPANKRNPAGRCPQALIFSTGTSELAGARFSLQCIQQFAAGEAAKDVPRGPQP
jgi:hypothetical protein